MKKLNGLKLKTPEIWQKERLAHWLYEWNLLRASIRTSDAELHESKEEPKAKDILPKVCIAQFDSNIEAGQIRLLAPQANENMIFVAVTSVEPDGKVEIVPFGLLSEPATPDELLSERDTEVVRVYCLWNARSVMPSILDKSWVVDKLDKAETEHLLKTLVFCKTTGRVPENMQRSTGPPLIHPNDPRREYRNHERQRIDKALAETKNINASNVVHYDIDAGQQRLRKAAEDREQYD